MLRADYCPIRVKGNEMLRTINIFIIPLFILYIYLHYKSLGLVQDFLMFQKEGSAILHLFDQKYSKNSNIVKYYYYNST